MEDSDFSADAAIIGCDVAAIKAVTAVESQGSGFNPDHTPVTLFEALWFHKLTKGIYDKSYPNLSSPVWDRTLYAGAWKGEQTRLQKAMAIDRDAALQSASWGMFQIMGFNHVLCGFSRLQDFVNAMYKDEASQLGCFTQYVMHSGLDKDLRAHDWASFAYRYNGRSYRANGYDTKLARAYQISTTVATRQGSEPPVGNQAT